MENTKLINQNLADFEDLINFFDNKYYDMIENTNKMDELYWDIEKEGIGGKLVLSLEELINILDNELKKIYKAEELIYEEMKNVMPEQSSVTALKSENESILRLLDSLKSAMNNKENLKKQKDHLQAEMVAIADLIQRNIHKKINVFFHEVRTMLPEEKRDEIVQKLNLMVYSVS